MTGVEALRLIKHKAPIEAIKQQLDNEATDVQMILAILQQAQGGWVGGLYQKTHAMVHSRISDLRKKGYKIECKCFGAGDYRYRLAP
jgi:hypothetical protein